MKHINEVYALEEGKTYWVCVGNKNYPPTQQEIKQTANVLKQLTKFEFIVSDYRTKPIMIKQKKVKK